MHFFNLLFIFLVGVCNHFKKDIKGIEAKSKRKHVDIQIGSEMPSWFESSDPYSTVARGDSPEFVGQVRDGVKECLFYKCSWLTFLNRGSSLLWLWAQHTKKYKVRRTLLWKYTLKNTSETVVCTSRNGYLGFLATLQKHSFWMKIALSKKIIIFNVAFRRSFQLIYAFTEGEKTSHKYWCF